MRVEVGTGRRVLHAATVGVALAYSPELRFIGTDLPFLQQIARAGGGTVLTSARQALSEPLPAVNVAQPLFQWLLVLAAVLLPVDVALRRLVLSRRPLPAPGPTSGPTAATARRGKAGHKEQAGEGEQGDDASPPPGEPQKEETVLATRLLERLRR